MNIVSAGFGLIITVVDPVDPYMLGAAGKKFRYEPKENVGVTKTAYKVVVAEVKAYTVAVVRTRLDSLPFR
jgi:hypothetical protein